MPAPKGNKNALGNKGGGVTRYYPELGKEMVAWFEEQYKQNIWPTFVDFSLSMPKEKRIWPDKFTAYSKRHLEFRKPYRFCKRMACNILMRNALSGKYNASFAQFVAGSNYGMKDIKYIDKKVESKVEQTTKIDIDNFDKFKKVASEFENKLQDEIKK